jgi:prefoldin alpha subunit
MKEENSNELGKENIAENNHEHDGHKHSQDEQEKLFRLSMLEQQARQIEQQLQAIEQQIIEMQLLKMNLDELKKSDTKEEVLASIGRNIFVKTSLKDKELFVDVGAKTIVKKSIDEAKEIIDKDIARLTETREKIFTEFNAIVNEINRV